MRGEWKIANFTEFLVRSAVRENIYARVIILAPVMSEVPLRWQYQRCQRISPKQSNDKGNEEREREDPLRARARAH